MTDRRYSDDLAEPIWLPDRRKRGRWAANLPIFYGLNEKRDDQVTVANARANKLTSLFKHYGVNQDDPDCWEILAIHLAIAHVPGFQSKNKDSGRPTTITMPLLREFFYHARRVSRRSRTKPLTEAATCAALTKSKDFKARFPALAKLSPKRLQNLLTEAKETRRCYLVYVAERRRVARLGLEMVPMGDAPPRWPIKN